MTTAKLRRPALILASASPRRQDILRRLGIPFRTDPSGTPETGRRRGESPGRYAKRLAEQKVHAVRTRHRKGIIVGADTIVCRHGRILGKPRDVAEARGMLRLLRGGWHEVVTGLCLFDLETGVIASSATSTRVHFRNITKADIDRYLATGEHADKAGAYAIQGFASLFTDRIEGCYFNVVGFPVAEFDRLLGTMGIHLLEVITARKQREARGFRESVDL